MLNFGCMLRLLPLININALVVLFAVEIMMDSGYLRLFPGLDLFVI